MQLKIIQEGICNKTVKKCNKTKVEKYGIPDLCKNRLD